MTTFPTLSDTQRQAMLHPAPGPRRVIVDTDAANEIDDQYAIAWALLSPEILDVEAIIAEPFGFVHHREHLVDAMRKLDDPAASIPAKYRNWATYLRGIGSDAATLELTGPAEGMELSYQEILNVLDKLGLDASGRAFRGSTSYMKDAATPVESEGAHRIVEAAMSGDERPLYIAAIGAVTNVASALLIEPRIAEKIVITWTSGYPTWTNFSNEPSLNLVQDVHASRLLFDSGAPMVYLPGYHIGAQLRISRPELETWAAGRGDFGDYLLHLYDHNPILERTLTEPYVGQSWVIWDLINIAWLIDPALSPTLECPTPTLDDELRWAPVAGSPTMLEGRSIDRDGVFRDFFEKLDRHREIVAGHPWNA